MQSLALIYPMAAMVLLTFIVMYTMLVMRVKAVRTRKISPRYFKLYRDADIPDKVLAISHNFTNLFELPILFYIVCIVAIMLEQSMDYFVVHAWIFVVLRYTHTLIHTTYNHILHRLYAFALSGFVLLSMWVKIVLVASTTV